MLDEAVGAVQIQTVRAGAFRIPTDKPEADGTFKWDATTLVTVDVQAGGQTGIGYTYTDRSAVEMIAVLAKAIDRASALDIPGAWLAMQRAVRNIGREGLAATAISALDTALWDLKAKLLRVPLVQLLGHMRDRVPIYGSGGFTSYSDVELQEQLRRWVEDGGCRWVKMKIGTEPAADPGRVEVAREAIGDAGLFVDANGAYTIKQSLAFADDVARCGVEWFEEPVSSDDLDGLRFVREHAPDAIEVAAGEYGYTLDYFRRMLAAGSVDVLQADATRCGGISGFLQAATLCEAHHIDLSSHCAPALHLHVACAAPRFRHQEWFHDHVRIEQLLFDGAPVAHAGTIRPDLSRPGLGLEFKYRDAERYRIA